MSRSYRSTRVTKMAIESAQLISALAVDIWPAFIYLLLVLSVLSLLTFHSFVESRQLFDDAGRSLKVLTKKVCQLSTGGQTHEQWAGQIRATKDGLIEKARPWTLTASRGIENGYKREEEKICYGWRHCFWFLFLATSKPPNLKIK